MDTIIETIEQVTPGWLTGVLRERGALPQGCVTEVTPDEGQTSFASAVWRLAVAYSQDATPGAPRRLFLKVTNPALAPGEFDPRQLEKEFTFYDQVAPAMRAPFAIPCYSTAYLAETGAGHILLKDVLQSHTACREPLQANCERAVDALAQLHAFWWDHPRLGVDVGRFPSAEERQRGIQNTLSSTGAFMAALGDQITPAWRANYEKVLNALPGLFQRHAQGRNLTLVHGDAHLGNFLFARDGEDGPAYLLDWQFWHPTIGGTDLAFMIATSWDAETRRQLEGLLLRRYYQGLLAGGVRGYRWEDCWDDYRLSVILVSIFIPVWQWAVFGWAPNFEALASSMAAFTDLGCVEML